LATYVQTIDPTNEVPPPHLLGGDIPRAVPYLYTQGEIAGLMSAASRLRPELRAATYETVIGLLAVSGMRVGEVIALDRHDVDLDVGLVTIRRQKFDRARIVPLHPTTTAALGRYAARRDELRPSCPDSSFFVSIRGTRLLHGNVHLTFSQLLREVGSRPDRHAAGPGCTIKPTSALCRSQREGPWGVR
jgi:integrase